LNPKLVTVGVTIRPATANDCPGILVCHVAAIRELCAGDYSATQLLSWSSRLTAGGYLPAIRANVFLVAERAGEVIGFGEFAPARGEVVAVYVHPRHARQGVGTLLFRAIERSAAESGNGELSLSSSVTAVSFYERLGFVAGPPTIHRLSDGTEIPCVPMRRTTGANLYETYEQVIVTTLRELGIPATFASESPMPFQYEATDLVSIGVDLYGREQRLTPIAAERWLAMLAAAQEQGVTLQLVSAFRSVSYQRQIWERKLSTGQSVEEILQVNAPPGYSEHHTGRALDITTPGCEPLTEEFETTSAFAWMREHAGAFGFSMTYPRNNPCGVIYEPWHWSLTVRVTGERATSKETADDEV
jgi:D-alanyl-D-alanine carboxypeptidase